MARISDGFELADVDLELRGEGALLGLRQSGVPDLRHARLARQRRLAAQARVDAKAVLAADPDMSGPGCGDRRRGHPAGVRRGRRLARAAIDCGCADRGRRAQGDEARGAAGPGARPTSDRVREALFSILGDVDGARVLEPFAGTGALGFEALSRGAESVAFCELDARPWGGARERGAAPVR